MTTIYAVQTKANHPYFKLDDEIWGGAPNPVSAFNQANRLAEENPAWTVTLVQREDGGEWAPVPDEDLPWIAEWARHAIDRRLARVPGYGWSSCECGWSTGTPGTHLATEDFDRAAAEHIAAERQRAKEKAGRAA